MVRFGLCDDDMEYITSIQKLILDEFAKYEIPGEKGECILYNSGDELLENFIDDKIDVIFMDIECGKDSGFDIMKNVCKLEHDKAVVYMTNYENYISRAFVCRPLGFVRKNFFKEDIEIPMNNIVEYIENKRRIVMFHNNKKEYPVAVENLIAVEVYNHDLELLYCDKKIVIKDQLSKVEKMLEEAGFIKVNRSAMVNIRAVVTMENQEIEVTCGHRFSVSRERVKGVEKQLAIYRMM